MTLLVILLLVLISASHQQSALNDFSVVCGDVVQFQNCFDNNCYFSPDYTFGNLSMLVKIVNDADSNLSIDDFIRNVLFKNTTQYFENKYSNNSYYMNAVAGINYFKFINNCMHEILLNQIKLNKKKISSNDILY